jgi:hypothetical protein
MPKQRTERIASAQAMARLGGRNLETKIKARIRPCKTEVGIPPPAAEESEFEKIGNKKLFSR